MKSTSIHVYEIHFQILPLLKTYIHDPKDENYVLCEDFYHSNLK